MNHQDWKPIILKKNSETKKTKNTILTCKNNLNNNQVINTDINLKKLDKDDIVKIDYVPKEISKKIQQARLNYKMSQEALANKLNIKKNVINDLESGKLKYDKAFVNKVNKILKII